MIYLLALGSTANTIPKESWDAWTRTYFEFNGIRYIGSHAPLFVHQYSHAWFDFRAKRDNYADYFTNSITLAGGESLDVILDASNTANFPAGSVFYLYTPQLDHLANDQENFGGLMTEVHIN